MVIKTSFLCIDIIDAFRRDDIPLFGNRGGKAMIICEKSLLFVCLRQFVRFFCRLFIRQ